MMSYIFNEAFGTRQEKPLWDKTRQAQYIISDIYQSSELMTL
jgi:hypothetical protein